jgi:hypothetical protein
MSFLAICLLILGLWVTLALFAMSLFIVAGKADEELGIKIPYEELISESGGSDSTPYLPSQPLYESTSSNR